MGKILGGMQIVPVDEVVVAQAFYYEALRHVREPRGRGVPRMG